MADADPSCPRCTGPVRPDWDWCLNCGYDPERLKPPGWMPGPPPTEPQPPKGRRARRAAKAEAAATSRGSVAIDLRTPAMPALVTTPPGAAPRPTEMARPPAEMTRPPAPVAPPVRQPTGPVTDLPFTPPTGLATGRDGAQPHRDIGAATTFSLPPNRLDLAGTVALGLAAAGMASVAVASLGSLAGGTTLNKVVTGLFILLSVAIAAGLAAQAYALVKVKVVIGPDELVAANRLGRPRRAELSQIFSVTLSTRHYDVGLGRHHTAEMPYVQVTDGAGFWIDALGGRSGEDPTPEQLAVLDRLHQVVASYRVAPPAS